MNTERVFVKKQFATFLSIPVYEITGGVRKKGDPFIACADINKEEIYIFPEFYKLSVESRLVVLAHEYAHIKYKTTDETFCNNFAVKHTVYGYNGLVKALNETKVIREELLLSIAV